MITFLSFSTWLGSWDQVVILTFFSAALFLIRGWRREAGILAVTVLSAKALEIILKHIFQRERPDPTSWLTDVSGFSFPSGHATVAMALYGLLGYILWKNFRKKWQKILVIFLSSFLILSISLSRVFLGVHWFSDVIGGWLAGGIVLAGAIFFLSKRS